MKITLNNLGFKNQTQWVNVLEMDAWTSAKEVPFKLKPEYQEVAYPQTHLRIDYCWGRGKASTKAL